MHSEAIIFGMKCDMQQEICEYLRPIMLVPYDFKYKQVKRPKSHSNVKSMVPIFRYSGYYLLKFSNIKTEKNVTKITKIENIRRYPHMCDIRNHGPIPAFFDHRRLNPLHTLHTEL